MITRLSGFELRGLGDVFSPCRRIQNEIYGLGPGPAQRYPKPLTLSPKPQTAPNRSLAKARHVRVGVETATDTIEGTHEEGLNYAGHPQGPKPELRSPFLRFRELFNFGSFRNPKLSIPSRP